MALVLAPERIRQAEFIAARVRQLLIAAATEGMATGHLEIHMREGNVSTIESRLVTGPRDGYRFPVLDPPDPNELA